ncbi:MAG: tetratricopeptide repeat protein [Porphyromonadaceae bacterium]|nr:tetratricopeptide repeat protein [Porphyromonadaceae bacterium]
MVLTILTEYALKAAIQVGLELKKIYTSEVDDGITKAFRLALNDWSKHDPSSSDEVRLTKALKGYIQSPTSCGVLDTDTQEFIDCFKKRLSEQPAAHNYLMTLRADEQADYHRQVLANQQTDRSLLLELINKVDSLEITAQDILVLLKGLPLEQGLEATESALEEMSLNGRIHSERERRLILDFVRFYIERTNEIMEETKRQRVAGNNNLAETLEDIKRVLAGESKRSLTAIHEEFKERKRQEEIQEETRLLEYLIEVAQLQFSFEEACYFYERLLKLAPTAEYHFNYALLLQNLNEFGQARSHYEEALQIYRDFWKKHPEAYKPHVAKTLNNLGVLLSDIGELKKAQTHYEEALKFYKELANENPQAYNPDVAMMLNNLGVLLSDIRELKKAQTHYEEALKFYKELEEKNPQAYNPDVAMTLNNLGTLLRDLGELKEAQAHCEEALKLYRELANKNPQAYKPYVATTLNNSGILLKNLGELKEAQTHYEEALKIYRELAEQNPQAYNPDVARTLNNLGNLLSYLGELKEAQTRYEEALKIRRELADKNPQVYKPNVATAQQNLAILYWKLRMQEKAEEAYQEARNILYELASFNPKAYGIDYANTLVMGVVSLGRPTEELEEARAILLKYPEHPKAQELLKIIDKRLKEQ